MKNKFRIAVFLLTAQICLGQSTGPKVSNPEQHQFVSQHNRYVLPIDKVSVKGSYPLGVSEIKTVHVIFPSEIKEVDAGTANVIAQITENFNNVLRIKANTDKHFSETNLTVLTADGGLYSFLTNYNRDPEILNINIGNNLSSDVLSSKDLGINQFLKSNYLIAALNQSANEIKFSMQKSISLKPFVRNTGVRNQNTSAFLKGVYTYNGMMYFTIEVVNDSEIDYSIDFIKLYIKDKEVLKRMTIQEEELKIADRFPLDNVLKAKTNNTFSLATPLRTISDDKEFEFEIYEQNGGRHLRFSISPKIIAKAKTF
ncbi:conjugative transposon protein TraN [Emticicia oligotrophica]|uniref:conjugative transposon protein TraN n=1 Tax=Emticicia oligotrophica TaxID=312279 RepID=UPI00273BB808|nr:conjugative transposon protein TraN [Emticicia oligotrophica]